MSNPPDPRRRLRDLIHATVMGSLEQVKDLGRADVELLARRVEELELDEHACAGEFVPWAIKRMKDDLRQKRDWLEDAIEQCRTAELCVSEAQQVVAALEHLEKAAMYEPGGPINERWDAVAEDYRARGMLPEQEAAAPVVEVTEPPPEPAPMAPPIKPEPEVLPDNLIAQLSKSAQAALKPAPPTRLPGPLSYTRPGDALTEKQGNVFRAILSAADAQWRAVISQGRIAKVSGEKAGGMWAHLGALEKKDFIRILDRGNATTPGSYLICERARPAREAPPKTDAELIAEAIAAGRVTKVEPPGAVH